MALSLGNSLALSCSYALFTFAFIFTTGDYFIKSQLLTILGGFFGGMLFTFILTAVSNLEQILLGRGFQARFFPEVAGSMFIAVFACALVHRVLATSCMLYSIICLYYLNVLSQKDQNKSVTSAVDANKKKSRK